MAKRKKRRMKKTEIWKSVVVLALAALILGAFVFLLAGKSEPEPTEPPAPTLPVNPFSAEDFVYDGAFLSCTAAETTLGIDVSEHQKDIDWQQVKDAGIQFAMIRVGYRGNTAGGLYADENAKANFEGARAAGLELGAYFYSQALTPAEARQEAAFVLEAIRDVAITYPVVFDWEYVSGDARTGDMDSRTLTDCTIAFCETIREAGYTPMVYFNQHMSQTLFRLMELQEYDFWLAMYQDALTYPHEVAMWQYTRAGAVPGISGEVDINLCFRKY